MRIGVPREIKDNENRVGLTPHGVAALRARGHEIVVERGAGLGLRLRRRRLRRGRRGARRRARRMADASS